MKCPHTIGIPSQNSLCDSWPIQDCEGESHHHPNVDKHMHHQNHHHQPSVDDIDVMTT